jgi:hypothetical protein
MSLHRTIFVLATSTIGVAAAATPARAQRAPDMATLDRGDGITKIGVDLGLDLVDGPYDAVLRIEPFGQYVLRMGLGFYGAFPITRSFGGAGGMQPEDTFAIGNLDLGLLYVFEPSPEISWVFRGGVGLPTASDSADGFATNLFGTYPRLTDLALITPDALYLRVGVSPLIHVRRLYLRVDLGADIGSDDADVADELIRFNVGGGIDLGAVAVGAELVNLYGIDAEEFVHTIAGTIRIMGDSVQPLIAVGTPLDEGPRDAVPVFVSVGLQYVPR